MNALWIDQGKVKTALTVALQSGHVNCAKLLLNHGAKLSVKIEKYLRMTTSQTFRAIGQCGDESILKKLLRGSLEQKI